MEASVVMERAPPRSGGAPGLVGGGVNAAGRGDPIGTNTLHFSQVFWPLALIFYTSTSKLNPTHFLSSPRGARAFHRSEAELWLYPRGGGTLGC